jgi:hypothetical protein
MSEAEDRAQDRRAERALRAQEQQAAQRRQKEHESSKAQELIDEFVASAAQAGLATEELTARPYNGKGRYRTGLQGWFLRADQSVGVGADGKFYVLLVPPTRFGRLRTVTVTPSPPPLVVGEGGRDGDAVALATLLQRRLTE